MLWKLWKYEMRISYRNFVLMYAILIACVFLLHLNVFLGKGDLMNILLGLLTMIYGIMVFVLSIFGITNVIMTYRSSMFKKSAVLTHTFPVKEWQTLLVKTLSGVFWIFVTSVVVILSMLLLTIPLVDYETSFFDVFINLDWGSIRWDRSLFYLFLFMFIIILNITEFISMVYFALNITHSCFIQKARKFFAFAIVIGILFIQSLISEWLPFMNDVNFSYIRHWTDIPWIEILFPIALILLWYFSSLYLIKHKMEI